MENKNIEQELANTRRKLTVREKELSLVKSQLQEKKKLIAKLQIIQERFEDTVEKEVALKLVEYNKKYIEVVDNIARILNKIDKEEKVEEKIEV